MGLEEIHYIVAKEHAGEVFKCYTRAAVGRRFTHGVFDIPKVVNICIRGIQIG